MPIGIAPEVDTMPMDADRHRYQPLPIRIAIGIAIDVSRCHLRDRHLRVMDVYHTGIHDRRVWLARHMS